MENYFTIYKLYFIIKMFKIKLNKLLTKKKNFTKKKKKKKKNSVFLMMLYILQ